MTMRAGAVVFGDGVPIDTIMAAAVAGLRRDGIAVAGLLQRFGAGRAGCRREMWVEDVAGATCYRIDQDLGPGAVGCVLDEGGLGVAAAALRRAAGSAAEVAVVNRFGKSEAAGRGLRDEIAAILMAGMPLLIAVRDDLVADWEAFIGQRATVLAADAGAIRAWARDVVRPDVPA